jgi:phosphate acetyltransferase
MTKKNNMDLIKTLREKAAKRKKTIILPESYDERVISAAEKILKKKLAKVILIGNGQKISIKESKDLSVIDLSFSEQFADEYFKIKQKKKPDYTIENAREELKDPLAFACMLLKNNFADSIVAGSISSTGNVLRNGITIIGLAENNKTVSSFFLLTFPPSHALSGKVLAFADCAVIPTPTAEQLSDIAIQTSLNFKKLTGMKPRTAFLSFSTKGSSQHNVLDKVIEACKMTHQRQEDLVCEAELQFDAAFIPEVAKRKNPGGIIKGNANVFIFPDLNSGNIAYKIAERIGGAIATGPIVQGLAKPVMDLSRGCSAGDIVNMSAIACLF